MWRVARLKKCAECRVWRVARHKKRAEYRVWRAARVGVWLLTMDAWEIVGFAYFLEGAHQREPGDLFNAGLF